MVQSMYESCRVRWFGIRTWTVLRHDWKLVLRVCFLKSGRRGHRERYVPWQVNWIYTWSPSACRDSDVGEKSRQHAKYRNSSSRPMPPECPGWCRKFRERECSCAHVNAATWTSLQINFWHAFALSMFEQLSEFFKRSATMPLVDVKSCNQDLVCDQLSL